MTAKPTGPMMNYYKIRKSDAEQAGIDLFAHYVTETYAVVSDMDLRGVMGFDLSPEDLQRKCGGVEPLTPRQLAGIQRDPRWKFHKG